MRSWQYLVLSFFIRKPLRIYCKKTESGHSADDFIHKISVYNLVGEKMLEAQYQKQLSVDIDVGLWPSGLYIVTVNGLWVGKILVD